MNEPKVLILPDIHGRTFWKYAVQRFPKEQCPDLKIIFLGDYLDPYTGYDGISKEDAYVNFEDILDYAKTDNRVTLLIGNHDWHYFVNLDTCRMDTLRARNIEHLFIENISRFKLTETVNIGKDFYLFSHAGITSTWLNDISEISKNRLKYLENNKDRYINYYSDIDYTEKLIWITHIIEINKKYEFEYLEDCLQKYNDPYYNYFPSMVSGYRGGNDRSGSLIWADVHEHLHFFNKSIPGYYQIFGHTISYPNDDPKQYYIGDKFAMLDASCAFILDVEGKIQAI